MVLTLKIITQEKQLLEEQVDSVTLQTVQGEITVLPMHIPLFTRVVTGELTYRIKGKEYYVVVADGFLDVDPNSSVTLMVDTAIRSQDIDILKAQEAKQRAQEAMKEKSDRRDYALAEGALRKALMEIQAYNKRRKYTP